MTYLLDVNALIALMWPTHEHHVAMTRWFGRHAREGWSTNPLTQNGFVRVVSQQAFSGRSIALTDVAELLLRNLADPRHRLTQLDFGFEEVLGTCTGGLVGHRQLTDAWLLTAAVCHQMRLVTFDRGIESLLASESERAKHLILLGR